LLDQFVGDLGADVADEVLTGPQAVEFVSPSIN